MAVIFGESRSFLSLRTSRLARDKTLGHNIVSLRTFAVFRV